MSNYKKAKNCFTGAADIEKYVDIVSHKALYGKLCDALDKEFNMIILYGKSGTGKSCMLRRLYGNFKSEKEIHYFSNPPSDMNELYSRIYRVLTGDEVTPNAQMNIQLFLEFLKHTDGQREIIILLDEAQMYSDEMLNDIRLLSDSKTMRFIFSLHDLKEKPILSEDHFKSRTLEKFELKNLSKDELMKYIHGRLSGKDLFNIANSIKSRQIAWIYRFTKGNLREVVKLMQVILEIHEYYEPRSPAKIDRQSMSKKIIEMAAIKLGYIHA